MIFIIDAEIVDEEEKNKFCFSDLAVIPSLNH